MKVHDQGLRKIRLKNTPAMNHQGIATGCLVALIAVVLISVAVGVYVTKNYQTWLAHGIAAGMHALI